jgi:16S rRNA (uracil1498-N3)-methyltransferase
VAVSKPRAMDWLLEKCVELGVAEILPFVSARSIVRLEGKKDAKRDKWERIAVSAAKQCGRNRLPIIHPPLSFDEALSETKNHSARFLLDPTSVVGWKEASSRLSGTETFSGWIGPEGGFASAEREQALAAGLQPIRISEHVLRVETAAVAFAALATNGIDVLVTENQ